MQQQLKGDEERLEARKPVPRTLRASLCQKFSATTAYQEVFL